MVISITTNPYQGLKCVACADIRLLLDFNYYESLSGIEITKPRNRHRAVLLFQLLRIPIRDWNHIPQRRHKARKFQLLRIPIRDWNEMKDIKRVDKRKQTEFQLLRIPIRDWNEMKATYWLRYLVFQLLRIPIRDWNDLTFKSILAISGKFQLLRIPIRDWNSSL